MKGIWKLNWYISTITDVFLNQKRVNVFKHTVKMAPCDCFIHTVFSHTFALLWLRKTSVIVKMYYECLFVPVICRSLHFFGVSSFYSYYCVICTLIPSLSSRSLFLENFHIHTDILRRSIFIVDKNKLMTKWITTRTSFSMLDGQALKMMPMASKSFC